MYIPQSKQVHICWRTDVQPWIKDIFPGERMHQRDRGRSPRRTYTPTQIQDIVLKRTSVKELYLKIWCLNTYTAVSVDMYQALVKKFRYTCIAENLIMSHVQQFSTYVLVPHCKGPLMWLSGTNLKAFLLLTHNLRSQEGADINRVADLVWVVFVRLASVQYIPT